MKLKIQVQLSYALWLPIMILGAVCAILLGAPGALGFAAGVPAAYFAQQLVVQALTQRVQTRLYMALNAEDAITARRALSELAHFKKMTAWQTVMHLNEASILLVEGRFTEARELLESTPSPATPLALGPHVDRVLATAMAQSGDAANAVVVAERALAHPHLDPRDRHVALACLGIAHVLAGQPHLALGPLEESLPAAESPRAVGVRAYYLGEALRTLGRTEEAMAAYERAHAAAPDTQCGRLASTQHKVLAPYR